MNKEPMLVRPTNALVRHDSHRPPTLRSPTDKLSQVLEQISTGKIDEAYQKINSGELNEPGNNSAIRILTTILNIIASPRIEWLELIQFTPPQPEKFHLSTPPEVAYRYIELYDFFMLVRAAVLDQRPNEMGSAMLLPNSQTLTLYPVLLMGIHAWMAEHRERYEQSFYDAFSRSSHQYIIRRWFPKHRVLSRPENSYRIAHQSQPTSDAETNLAHYFADSRMEAIIKISQVRRVRRAALAGFYLSAPIFFATDSLLACLLATVCSVFVVRTRAPSHHMATLKAFVQQQGCSRAHIREILTCAKSGAPIPILMRLAYASKLLEGNEPSKAWDIICSQDPNSVQTEALHAFGSMIVRAGSRTGHHDDVEPIATELSATWSPPIIRIRSRSQHGNAAKATSEALAKYYLATSRSDKANLWLQRFEAYE